MKRQSLPADVITAEIVKKFQDMFLADGRTKVREVAEIVGMSYETAINILRDELGMRKISSRLVSRLLTVDHKRI